MEDKYGHYLDYILVNSDMELAYQELLMCQFLKKEEKQLSRNRNVKK
jgi:hypothetical protein